MRNVKPGHAQPVICLDAGHFGAYNQSPVVPEYYESTMNWKLQNFLKAELENYGIKVFTTRNDPDADMPLTSRGAASEGCDLLISLHANYAEDPGADYVLGIHMVQNGSRIAMESMLLADLLGKAAGKVMGASDVRLWTRAGGNDRNGDGFPDDYYGVLRGAARVGTAGVILEHGCFSNEAQARWLLDERNLMALAKEEARTLAQWFDVQEPGNPYLISLRSLPRGSRGPKVAAAQQLLIAQGYSCGETGADGSFGSNTERAVRGFQTDKGLRVDGIIGGQTMSCLLGYR